jgi:hypothetical protein
MDGSDHDLHVNLVLQINKNTRTHTYIHVTTRFKLFVAFSSSVKGACLGSFTATLRFRTLNPEEL